MFSLVTRWDDRTWELVRGCAPVSSGCASCLSANVIGFYSRRNAEERLVRPTASGYRWSGLTKLRPDALVDPFEWPSESRVVVCSHSDLFQDGVPEEFIADAFDVMANTDHTYLISTKRPHRMAEWFSSATGVNARNTIESQGYEWPLSNVWLGTSVENQAAANHRIPPLLSVPGLCTDGEHHRPGANPLPCNRVADERGRDCSVGCLRHVQWPRRESVRWHVL